MSLPLVITVAFMGGPWNGLKLSIAPTSVPETIQAWPGEGPEGMNDGAGQNGTHSRREYVGDHPWQQKKRSAE